MPKTKQTRPAKKSIRLDVDAYRGEWVALDPKTNRVVSHNPSLKLAERDARRRGVQRPLMLPVPESDAFFVGVHA